MDDDDALADAYDRALGLEKSGDHEAAAQAYRKLLTLDPDDHCGAAIRLAAMGRGETPKKAPDAYVAMLFDLMPMYSMSCWSTSLAIRCRCRCGRC